MTPSRTPPRCAASSPASSPRRSRKTGAFHFTRDAIEEVILEARRRAGRKGHLTLKLRELGGLVRVAGDIARAEDQEMTTRDDVLQAKSRSRSIEQQLADDYIERHKDYEPPSTRATSSGASTGSPSWARTAVSSSPLWPKSPRRRARPGHRHRAAQRRWPKRPSRTSRRSSRSSPTRTSRRRTSTSSSSRPVKAASTATPLPSRWRPPSSAPWRTSRSNSTSP